MVPVAIRSSYHLVCRFVRRTTNEAIGVTIPVGEAACAVLVNGWNGTVAGIEVLDGMISRPMPKPTPASNGEKNRQPCPLENAI